MSTYSYQRKPQRRCASCGKELPRTRRGTLCIDCQPKDWRGVDSTPPGWSLEGKSLTLIDMEARALGMSYGKYTAAIRSGMIERLLTAEGLEREDWERRLKGARAEYKDKCKLYGRKL